MQSPSKKTLARPTVLDLFSGVGGMSLGFESAGFDITAGVELDPIHCATHHFNFPYSTPICADISTLSLNKLEHLFEATNLSNIDVVVGGPPCQGFSQIGQRDLEDPRNQLVFQYVRIIAMLKPKYFVFENVPGIALGGHSQFLNSLVKRFHKIGYKTVFPIRILDAYQFGVAQRRRRLIILGYRTDSIPINYPIARFTTEASKQHLSLSLFEQHTPPAAKDVMSDLEDIPVFINQDLGIESERLQIRASPRGRSKTFKDRYSLCHRRHFNRSLVWGHVGSVHTELSIKRFSETSPGETEPISRFFRLHPDKPSNTLRAGTNSDHGGYTAPRPIHYSHPRCISIREAARLHSYPDWFQFHRTIWHGFRQIGNSVAPLFGQVIGTQILTALGIDSTRVAIYNLKPQDESLVNFNMSEAADYFCVDKRVIPARSRAVNS